jgi:hypothetical protein
MTDVVIELVEKWLEVNEAPTTPVITEKPIALQSSFSRTFGRYANTTSRTLTQSPKVLPHKG